jgi:hypothetical protein
MARVPGDEHVPAQLEELLPERVELLRAIRKPMKEDEGPLGSAAVCVEARMTHWVDVRTIELLEARGDFDSSLVCIAAHSRTGY